MSIKVSIEESFRERISVISMCVLSDGRLFVFGSDLRNKEQNRYGFYILEGETIFDLGFEIPVDMAMDRHAKFNQIPRTHALLQIGKSVIAVFVDYVVEWDLEDHAAKYLKVKNLPSDGDPYQRNLEPLSAKYCEETDNIYVLYRSQELLQYVIKMKKDRDAYSCEPKFFHLTGQDFVDSTIDIHPAYKCCILDIGLNNGDTLFHSVGGRFNRWSGIKHSVLGFCNWQGEIAFIEEKLPIGLPRFSSDGEYLILKSVQNPPMLHFYSLNRREVFTLKLTPKKIMAGVDKWSVKYDLYGNTLWLCDSGGAFTRLSFEKE